jgi:hypothetical protein
VERGQALVVGPGGEVAVHNRRMPRPMKRRATVPSGWA